MDNVLQRKLLAIIISLFVILATLFQYVMPTFAEETETDITDKVTIDSITSPNAETKDSENVNDFSSFVKWGSNVDYKIDMTVNKGTPIETGDIIEIPFQAERGELYESYGLSVLDAEDGSLLGEATITKNKIRIKFTKKNNTKTAVKLSVKTTLKTVTCGLSKGFPTQAEVDAEYAAHPTVINKVKILGKNANLNVQANYFVTSSEKFYGVYPTPTIGDGPAVFKLENGKSGRTSSTNASTHWDVLGGNGTYTYTVTSPATGKTNSTKTTSSALAAFLFGNEKVFSFFSSTETSYIEDTLPADTYKNMKLSNITLVGAGLYKDGKTPLLKQSSREGKFGDCFHLVESASFKFDEVLTKKEAASGQSYEQFKASLKPGEYGIYTSPNGDIRFVASLGKVGSKNPNDIYTWGNFADKVGKETVVRRLFPLFDIKADGSVSRITVPQEKIDEIYNKIKDWPISRIVFSFDSDLVKPVMRTGAYVENTAQFIDKSMTAKNYFVVGDISLHTYKDGAAILKTDAKSGQGIEKAEFKLQEKDPAGNWIDTDSQYVKDNVTVVGNNGGKKIGDRFYTSENGILNIRGLTNNKTYRLVETKAPEGYDNSNPAISKEFVISFTDKNAPSDNKDLTLTNKKSEYKVTYKIVKNPNGEEIPSGSPAAPVDPKTYNFHSTVDVKPDLTMTGYIFVGWHTENGQKVNVKDNDSSFTMPGGNVELVGYWINNTTEVSGEKTWDDANNKDGKRPNKITVNLLSNGNKIQTKDVTADATGRWLYSFKNLPKYDNQRKEIKYTVTEETVAGYTTEINGLNIKNTHTTEKINVSVSKKWVGKAASSAKIDLYADGVKKDSVTLNQANRWQHIFTNLDKYKNGAEIKYTVKEEAIANYKSVVSGDMTSGYTITNTNVEKLSIPVTKKWVGKAGDSATVKLLADGSVKETITLNAAGNWNHTFVNLPKYDANDGHEIVYTLDETKVNGYTTGISGTAMTGFTITNTITGKVSVPVTKKWIGKPASSAKIELYADGVKKDSITLNEENHWQHTFTNLDKYKNGTEIKYTVKEEAIANYKTVVSGDMNSGYMITNTNVEKLSIPVIKKWIGKAGDSATVKLFADGKLKETAVLNAASNWKHDFSNLQKYDANDGHEITYTIKEEAMSGYKTAISGDVRNGFVITNTQNAPKIPGKPNKPNTGDDSNLAFYGFVMLLTATGISILMRLRGKKNQR